MKLLKTILGRLEPWAMFLSILGILFVPWGKGGWWTILILVSFVRLVRAWRDAGEYFSLETMADVLGTGTFLVSAVLVFFFLHHAWPSLVHDRPDLRHLARGSWELRFQNRPDPGRLRIYSPHADLYDVSIFIGDPADGGLAASGWLRMRDLIIAASEHYRRPVQVHDMAGVVGKGCEAEIELDASGTPLRIRLRQGTEIRLDGVVQRRP